jgi:enoyl-CoA hydratase
MIANIETIENVTIITLDDGKANVFSPTMISEFNSLLDQVPTNKGSLLIHGREGMFSAGFDLKVMMSGAEPAVNMVRSGFKMLQRVFSFPRPVVASCTGSCNCIRCILTMQ